MRTLRRFSALCAIVLPFAAGCAGPVLEITHDLPSAVPLPDSPTMFRVTGEEPAGSADEHLAKKLKDLLAEQGQLAPGDAPTEKAVGIAFTSSIDFDDEIQGRGAPAEPGESDVIIETPSGRVEVESLVRKADAEVTFTLTSPPGGKKLFAIELSRSYSSLYDPRVRGPKGLRRADDPALVPTRETIAEELLASCARSLARMLQPQSVTAKVQTRGTLHAAGSKGLQAARDGDMEKAYELCRQAVADKPVDPGLHFNLAAVCEATGRLDEARTHYEEADRLKQGKDREAQEGALRAQRVAWALGDGS